MNPHYDDGDVTVYHGDCLDVLRELPDASVDAVITDPPYELGFMGRHWDAGGIAYNVDMWRQCLRVLRPGGHLLAFGGTRTYHRMACAIEDAGFEIRDSIHWTYGSGFPKSLDVSKAIDKAAGATREVVGRYTRPDGTSRTTEGGRDSTPFVAHASDGDAHITAPATDAARQWDGWGTALKPSHEPIVVARKPLVGTVAGNVLAHGTGAINIDGCRVEASGRPLIVSASEDSTGIFGDGLNGSRHGGTTNVGRWPANTILTHAADCDPDGGCGAGCPCAEMDAQSGVSTSVGVAAFKPRSVYNADAEGYDISGTEIGYGDTGGASRFFPAFYYTAKASSAERPRVGKAGGGNGKQNYGGYKVKCCDECGKRWPSTEEQSCGHDGWHWAEPLDRQPDTVAHPTVKPLDLMRWLVRLVTPPGGVVLEPFAGSGTTAEACVVEGFRCIAIEREADYLPLIVARLSKPIERTLL